MCVHWDKHRSKIHRNNVRHMGHRERETEKESKSKNEKTTKVILNRKTTQNHIHMCIGVWDITHTCDRGPCREWEREHIDKLNILNTGKKISSGKKGMKTQESEEKKRVTTGLQSWHGFFFLSSALAQHTVFNACCLSSCQLFTSRWTVCYTLGLVP